MTNIAYTGPSHLLIVHSPGEGTHPERERCPRDGTYERFLDVRAGLRKAKLPVPSIQAMFPEAFGSDALPAVPGLQAAEATDEYTLDEWLGTPDEPGPFFAHAADWSGGVELDRLGVTKYVRAMQTFGAHLTGRPMSQIGFDDARRYVRNLLACRPCTERAKAAGRSDILARPDLNLRGDKPSWDGQCFDDRGVSTHYVFRSPNTVRDYRSHMRHAFRVARWCGEGEHPRDRRCAENGNPFERLGKIKFDVRERPHDFAFALSHTQVKHLGKHMPKHYEAAVHVCTYGMFRRSELLGLSRRNLVMPTKPEDGRQALLIITHTWRDGELRAWGKTEGSTGTTVLLPASATDWLRFHLDNFRSTANPQRCEACRLGVREHADRQQLNPHLHCDFADEAPLWADSKSGERPRADYFSQEVFKEAVVAAGLAGGKFVPTLHTLRASGATLRLEAGEHIESVRKQGRWANLEVLLRHYYRPTDDARREANARLDVAIRAAAGEEAPADLTSDDEILRLQQVAQRLQAEVDQLLRDGREPYVPRRIDREERRRLDYTPADIRRAIAPPRSWREVAKRLGMTGAHNSLAPLKRIAKENGITLNGGAS